MIQQLYSKELERSIIGAMLKEPSSVSSVLERLTSEDFFSGPGKLCFTAIKEIADSGAEVDPITVVELLKRKKQLDIVGGELGLFEATENIVTTITLPRWVETVKDYTARRSILQQLEAIREQINDPDNQTSDILDGLEQGVTAIRGQSGAVMGAVSTTTFESHVPAIAQYYRDRGRASLFSTGLRSVDQSFKLQAGTLNILTGVPSHGKSEFLDQVMINTIRIHGWRWAIFSPENYPIENHFQKLAEKWSGKPFFHPSDREKWGIEPLTEQEVCKAINDLSANIEVLTIDRDTGASVSAVLKAIEQSHKRQPFNAFIIDPWNEVEHQRPAALSETEYIGRELSRIRNFARRLNIAAWIVAHPAKLRRDNSGQYPVPTAYDINGSANWRNKADACLCVWRDILANDGKLQLHIQKVGNKNAGRAGEVIELNWTRATGVISEASRY